MIDITGMRFGRLTVLRKDATRNNRAFWVCLCVLEANPDVCRLIVEAVNAFNGGVNDV